MAAYTHTGTLTRGELEAVCAPLAARLDTALARVFRKSGTSPDQVEMSGGGVPLCVSYVMLWCFVRVRFLYHGATLTNRETLQTHRRFQVDPRPSKGILRTHL